MMPLSSAVNLSRERSKKAVAIVVVVVIAVIVMVMMVVVDGIQNMVTQKVDMLYFMMA